MGKRKQKGPDFLVPPRRFLRAWRKLAKLGLFDDENGKEFCRVWNQWENEGRPRGVAAFIKHLANLLPWRV